MDKIAKIMSSVFSPILVPTYGVILAMTCSILTVLPASTKTWVAFITLLITGGIPVLGIAALYFTRRISDPGLNNRGERTWPYIFTFVAYLLCAFYLYRINAPEWLWSFPIGGAMAVAVSIVVNLRWKISAHLAAMGGLVAMLFAIAGRGEAMPCIEWVIAVTILLTGLLATSRIVLGRHTPWQTIAGAVNGFVCVTLASLLF